jgi:hypothetical protein
MTDLDSSSMVETDRIAKTVAIGAVSMLRARKETHFQLLTRRSRLTPFVEVFLFGTGDGFSRRGVYVGGEPNRFYTITALDDAAVHERYQVVKAMYGSEVNEFEDLTPAEVRRYRQLMPSQDISSNRAIPSEVQIVLANATRSQVEQLLRGERKYRHVKVLSGYDGFGVYESLSKPYTVFNNNEPDFYENFAEDRNFEISYEQEHEQEHEERDLYSSTAVTKKSTKRQKSPHRRNGDV